MKSICLKLLTVDSTVFYLYIFFTQSSRTLYCWDNISRINCLKCHLRRVFNLLQRETIGTLLLLREKNVITYIKPIHIAVQSVLPLHIYIRYSSSISNNVRCHCCINYFRYRITTPCILQRGWDGVNHHIPSPTQQRRILYFSEEELDEILFR